MDVRVTDVVPLCWCIFWALGIAGRELRDLHFVDARPQNENVTRRVRGKVSILSGAMTGAARDHPGARSGRGNSTHTGDYHVCALIDNDEFDTRTRTGTERTFSQTETR